MTRGLRTALWGLSSLAVLWTVSALVMAGMMGSMMGSMTGGGCPMCELGMGGGMMGRGAAGQAAGAAPGGGGMMGGGMMGGAMMGMMLTMGLTWVVMLGLDAVFVYLVVTALRGRGHSTAPTPTSV